MHDNSHTYLTVSYAKDLPSVVRLRASLGRCGDTTPHHIVVHTEDMAAFREALKNDVGVVLRATADILPPMQESARRLRIRRDVVSSWKTRLLRVVGGSEMRESLRVRGWHFQQLSKLYAARSMPTECVVILDSDILALARPSPAHFLSEGRCMLYERRSSEGSEQYTRWLRETRAGLGLAPAPDDFVNYVFGPVVWSRSVVQCMFDELGAKEHGSLARFFLRTQLNSEYYLYGLYARSRAFTEAALTPTNQVPSIMIGLQADVRQVADLLRRNWSPDKKPFLWAQGYLGISDEEMQAAIRAAAVAKSEGA